MKLTLTSILSGLASIAKLNANFTAIASEFQDKVLYRNNPSGEPNQMESDLDMNSNSIQNADTVYTQTLYIGGVEVVAGSVSPVPVTELGNGTAAAPALYFTSDPDTGVYRVNPDELGFAAGGDLICKVTASGINAAGYDLVVDDITADDISFDAASGTSVVTTGAGTFGGLLTAEAGLTVTGTVTLPAFAINSASTATTQAPGDNTTKVATTAFVTAAVSASGALRQCKTFTLSTASGVAAQLIPDGGTPQNADGTAVFAEAFTPTASDSIIEVDVHVQASCGSGADPLGIAIYKDSTADCEVASTTIANASVVVPVPIKLIETAGSTSARTYRVRIGNYFAGRTVYINRSGTYAAPYGSGKVISTMVIKEYAP
jgi:hypothetical protein